MNDQEVEEFFNKNLWIKLLCAWNNVPEDFEHIKTYANEKWSVTSKEGWKRVAKVALEEAKKHLERG